ncbi:MAG: elongation factor G, partial [Ilumatobacteraceae bacterium]
MTTIPTERIRNVVLVGHSGAGTTTVAEALLARAGAIARAGRVDDGTSVLDTEPEAVKRHLSLAAAIAPFEWTAPDGLAYRVNLIDTPGYPDFVGEVEAAMAVADLAVFVVSAVDGIEVQTELLWRRAAELQLPRMVFVNKEDRDRADFHAVLAELSDVFGGGFVALELPLGEAGTLHGVADVLSEQAFDYQADGAHSPTAMPDDVAVEEHHLHDSLVEEIVAGDDQQLERYLAGDVPSVAELEHTLAGEVVALAEFPVLLGSATTGVGIDRLADFICELAPAPSADPEAPPAVFVFKTIADPFAGQLSLFTVLAGRVSVYDQLVNLRTGVGDRFHALFRLRGSQQEPVTSLVAGDIGAVAKLSDAATFDVYAAKGASVVAPNVALPTPVYAVAISPRTQSDDDKMGVALQRLTAEDPVLRVERHDQTHQTVLRGLGDMHLAVALERMKRKFGVDVDVEDVRVPYRETITGRASAEGKVKKQSGGHGQFAVVQLDVEPLERGGGFEFVDAIVGGAIPKNYVAAVHRGIEETMAGGGVHGFPVVDVRVRCTDGKTHAVDSSDMAFRTAAALGFKDALG